MEKIIYTITEANLLHWYYNTGQDTEMREIREDLGQYVIDCLMKGKRDFKFKTKKLFKSINKGAIKVCYIEEFKGREGFDDGQELSDVILEGYKYKVKVIYSKKLRKF
jgi:hypothetical protein